MTYKQIFSSIKLKGLKNYDIQTLLELAKIKHQIHIEIAFAPSKHAANSLRSQLGWITRKERRLLK